MISLLLLALAQDAAMRQGAEAYRAGDYAKAAAHFGEAARQKETSAEAWTNLGHARAALGEIDAARTAYERALSLGTADRPRVALALARLQLDAQPDAAAKALAEALDHPDTAADAWLLLGRAREALGERTAAVDAYRQAAARAPANEPLRARLSQLLLELGRGAEAADLVQGLVSTAPANAEWRLLMAQAALQAGDADAAEKALTAARLLGADRPSLDRTLGDLLLSKDRGREAAVHYARVLSSAKKTTPDDRLRMGLALLQAGELSTAEAALRSAAAESEACHRGLLALARTLSAKRGLEPALAALDAMPAGSPWAAAARLLRAETLLRADREVEALEALDAAWAGGERARDFLAAYLSALARAGRATKTVQAEALARFPEDPVFRTKD